MSKFLSLKDIVLEVTIAAIYVVLVLAFYFMSFEVIQFRIAEILLVLVFFNKKHTIGLVFGTFLANWIGAFGIIDAFYGSFATLITCILLIMFKKHWYIALIIVPGLINGLVISFEISYLYQIFDQYWLNFLWIFIGEFAVVTLIGIPFKLSLEKTQALHFYIK